MKYLLAVALLLIPAAAMAGDRTSTPTWLRGDVYAGYEGGMDLVELQDRNSSAGALTEVGRYTQHRHGMRIQGAFSVYHGVAVTLKVPIAFHHRLDWQSANGLVYDPDFGRPTAVGGSALSEELLLASSSSRVRNGFGDMSLGFRVVPFAERGLPGRKAPASVAVDMDIVFPSGGNHDKVRDNGSAGPGEGGMQLRLGIAASRRLGGSEPYLAVTYTHRGAYNVDLSGAQVVPSEDVDEEGLTRLNPADEVEFRFGAEIIAREDDATDSSVRMDVGFGMTYVGPDQVSSGTRLAAPLDETAGHTATTAEHVILLAGLGLRIRPKSQVELRVDIDGGWMSPHVVEQVDAKAYTANTGLGSFVMRWGIGALVRIR